MDSKGHIVHIDFGFILTIGPSVLGRVFENAPFKMTKDYITLLEGEKSELFDYFTRLLLKGMNIVREHAEELCDLLDMMSRQSTLACFEKFELKEYREKIFRPDLALPAQVSQWVSSLLKESVSSSRTVWYDDFQKISNGIMP